MALYEAPPEGVGIEVEITNVVFEDGEELKLFDSYEAFRAAQQTPESS